MLFNQFKTKRELILFLLLPRWKAPYEAYLQTCNFTKKAQAKKELDARQNIYAWISICGWISFGFLTEWLPFVFNSFFGSWYRVVLATILLAVFALAVVMTYRGSVNAWAIRHFVLPDHAKITDNDAALSIEDLPEPNENGFPLGANARGAFLYSMDKPTFAGHIAIAGRHQFREGLHLSVLYGIMSDERFVAQVYDTDGGLDLGYLKYDYRNLLQLKSLDNLMDDERRAELANIAMLPNVVVRSEDGNGEIQTALNWLSQEFNRRSRERALEPEATFTPFLAVLDEGLATAFVKGDVPYQVDVLHNIASRGKMLSMHLLIVLPPPFDWSGINEKWRQDFDCLEVHHSKLVGKEGNPVATKNVVPAHNMVFQLYHSGTPLVLKAPTVSAKQLAERIYLKSAKSPAETLAMWKACLNNRSYRAPGKPPIIVQDANGLRKAA